MHALASEDISMDGPPPLILIIEDQEWPARALEAVLAPAGYAVLRAFTGRQGLARALAGHPDAILVDVGLPDMSGLEICRTLVADERIGPATPLVVTTAQPESRRLRMDALRAGAWDFVSLPPDSDELLAKLGNWIAAKREIERVRDGGLLDFATGVYNTRGLLQRAGELAAEAVRYQRPLACVVFTVAATDETGELVEPDPIYVQAVRDALRDTLRACDALGRLTPGQLAVLAPATDASGALRLAQRALEALDRRASTLPGAAPPRIEAGFFGVDNFREARLEAGELLARAAIALRAPGGAQPDSRIHAYPSTIQSLN